MLSTRKSYSLSSELMLSKDLKTPLDYAIERGHVECVRVLLEHGADPTVAHGLQHPPIIRACFYDQLKVVKLMVDTFGKDIQQSRSEGGSTTLHNRTISLRSCDFILYLVENGVNINETDMNGNTPLSNAIQFGQCWCGRG